MSRILIKYGGAAMEDQQLCRAIAEQITKLFASGNQVVVVHGGGKEITAELQKVGAQAKFVNGLRYTDAETLRICEMVLSGSINKRLVSYLMSFGAQAVGISGRDQRIILVEKLTSSDLGFVGEVKKVSPRLLELLLTESIIPVISPVCEDLAGQPYNVNADEVAQSLAESLRVDELVFLSDVDGLTIGGEVVQKLSAAEVKKLLTHPEVKGGMIPKLTGALRAVENGVKHVRFLNGTKPKLLEDLSVAFGTEIVK